jgi:hypothetical protein
MWDVEEIEREKEEEEYRALAEGELLAANLTRKGVRKLSKWFIEERLARQRELKRRLLTGDAWSLVVDPVTFIPFWYNDDTGEAQYGRPKVIEEREALETALERGFIATPLEVMIKVLSFLVPYPDRMSASSVCSRWRDAAGDASFLLRVLSVESGVRDAVAEGTLELEQNTYTSVEMALSAARPGDTISLGVGHHWEGTLRPRVPVRLVGESDDPSRCVVEITGELRVTPESCRSIVLYGLTVRHPRKVADTSTCVSVEGSKLTVTINPQLFSDSNLSLLLPRKWL